MANISGESLTDNSVAASEAARASVAQSIADASLIEKAGRTPRFRLLLATNLDLVAEMGDAVVRTTLAWEGQKIVERSYGNMHHMGE